MDEKIFSLLKQVLALNSVDNTCSQATCDKWDSLKHLELIIELESEFGVELEPEEIVQMKSFTDIKTILSSKQ